MSDKWYVTDFEGDPCHDENGELILFDNYDDARALSKKTFGAIILMKDSTALVEIEDPPTTEIEKSGNDELTDLERLHTEMVAQSLKRVRKNRGPLDPEVEAAYVAFEMIGEALRRKRHLNTITLTTVMEVSRKRLHKVLGYTTVRDFLREAGMNPQHGHLYHLSHVGDVIVPYLESKNLDVGEFVEAQSNLIEASSVLKDAILDQDEEKTQEILRDIRVMESRDDIRAKWRQPRDVRGTAYEGYLDEGETVAVIILKRGENLWLRRILSNQIQWDLTGAVHQNNTGLRLDVSL